jgi:hypothetical protein
VKIAISLAMRHGEFLAGDELRQEEIDELLRWYTETLTARQLRRAFESACRYASVLKGLATEAKT